MPKRYATIANLPATIPVFPLVGAILLPRATMPLNIFEPRYLAMFDEALRGDRLIGIIQPGGDGGPTGSPQGRSAGLRSVGCAGRITAYQEQPDGRLVVGLTGICRFNPGAEQGLAKPFRTVEAGFAPYERDLAPDPTEADVDRERLVDSFKKFLAQRQLEANWQPIEKTGTEQLVNWLSVAGPFRPEEKQALLEAVTVAARADTIIALTEMDIAAGSSSAGSKIQ